MASTRLRSNGLALAVLALLHERPMHPYEMVSVLRERVKHETVNLKYSSLYSTVGALHREGFVVPQETSRTGRRPERTVYALTEAGSVALREWLRDLLRIPAREYTQFGAGLSFLLVLSPAEALTALEERVQRLRQETTQERKQLLAAQERGLAWLFLIEHEHGLVLREAELHWLERFIDELHAETLQGLTEWQQTSTSGGLDTETEAQ